MARKTLADLKTKTPGGTTNRHDKSWAALGWDTSLTSVACVGSGYDCVLDRRVGPSYAEIRWMPDDDYFMRLGQAAKAHELALDVLGKLGMPLPINRVYHAIEEPFPLGIIARAVGQKGSWQGSFIKQQSEVSGCVKGSLVRWGYLNVYEINNSQWHATLRADGVEFETIKRDWTAKEKADGKKRNKFAIKPWAIKAFGLPDLPDLVKSKSGAKIPRPDEGFGAKAKPEQPNDIYDAAAVCAWMCDNLPS